MSPRIVARCASALLCAGLAGAQEWTEQSVIQAFLTQNPLAREAAARTDAIRAEAQGRTLYPNPQVSFSHEGAGVTQFFEIQQTISWSGRRRLLKEAGDAAVAVSSSEGTGRLWNLRVEVRHLFYRLLAAQQYEEALAGGVADLDNVVRILRTREQEGESSRYDRLRAERERAEFLSQLATARAAVAERRTALTVLVPSQAGIMRATGTLNVKSTFPGADEISAQALSSRAEYLAEQQQTIRYHAEQAAAERLRYPEPIISVGLKRAEELGPVAPGRLGSFTGYGPAASVAVPIPIFNKGRTEVARFRAELEQSAARRDAIERRIRAEIAGARETLVLRQEALENYRSETSARGSQLSRIVNTAYQEGEVGILELLDSYRVTLQSRTRLLELELAVKDAAIELDRFAGAEVTR